METNNVPAPRTPLNLDVSFKRNYAREESKGALKNISISGAFLQILGESFTVGEKLHLNFKVAGRERKIHAEIVWLNNFGAGIKFLPLNKRDVQIVDDLIYFVENQRSSRRDVLDNIFKKVA